MYAQTLYSKVFGMHRVTHLFSHAKNSSPKQTRDKRKKEETHVKRWGTTNAKDGHDGRGTRENWGGCDMAWAMEQSRIFTYFQIHYLFLFSLKSLMGRGGGHVNMGMGIHAYGTCMGIWLHGYICYGVGFIQDIKFYAPVQWFGLKQETIVLVKVKSYVCIIKSFNLY